MAKPPPDLEPGPFLRFLRRRIWVIGTVAMMVAITYLRFRMRHVPDPPPVVMTLPQFSLVDQDGKPFDNAALSERVWVASFIFTSCPSTCPAVTQAMLRLQERYDLHGHDIGLLAISVDPETDTPQVLSAYAAKVGADPARWRFVTGDPKAVRDLVVGGFALGMGEPQPASAGLYDIAHSTKLAIVDPSGGVRGYYGIDEEGLDEVFHRSTHVVRELRTLENRR